MIEEARSRMRAVEVPDRRTGFCVYGVKVLDFGLAKALGDEMGGDLSNSPTMSLAGTRAGVILGTAAYMSVPPVYRRTREA